VQEEVIPFFQQVRFSKEADTALKCMRELSELLRADLKRVDPYFEKLADGMVTWCDCWEAVQPESAGVEAF
jgi:reversibly glycosylated polypeptide / UDP-arabinopyranose mutase